MLRIFYAITLLVASSGLAGCETRAALAPRVTVAPEIGFDLTGRWSGSLVREGRTYPLRVDIVGDADSGRATVDLPQYSIYGSAGRLSHRSGKLRLEAPLARLELDGSLKRGIWSGSGTFGELESEFRLRRTSPTPVTYRYLEVVFEHGDARLVGTLVLPGNGEPPFPVVVWTHGSGQQTRETFFYAGRGHLAAQHGVASFIYDKRGAGESTGSQGHGVDLLVGDALAAVGALRERDDVDGERIGIAGFSQGGWIAPRVAAQDPEIAFVLAGATPGITGGEQNIFSLENHLRDQGFSEPEIERAKQVMHRVYDFYQTGEGRKDVVSALEEIDNEPWAKDSFFIRNLWIPESGLPDGRHPSYTPFSPDPLEAWRGVHVPVLSIWGELDRDVPARLSREQIAGALDEIGNLERQLLIFPGASHGLWSRPPEDEPWDWHRQAPGYHEAMVVWLVEQTRR